MYIKRDLERRFLRLAEHYPVLALVGPRQSGKTTMLKHIMKGYDASYVLFDDPDARRLFDEDVKKFAMQYMDGYELTVLDEIQYCKDAGQKLKYLADSGYRMWVTSSSELLLGKDVLSYLVGRVGILRLYPFNFHEFLRAKGIKVVDKEIIKRAVWEHALYGGYPHVVLTPDTDMKKEILKNLYETILMKDVIRTFTIDNIGALERLARYLAINSGSIAQYSNIASAMNLSFQTLKKYLDSLAKSEIIVNVVPFFTNQAKEITKQPKIYYLDTGLRNAVVGQYPLDMDGAMFENYVLSELLKMGYVPKYWRTKSKSEVDFIVERDGKIIAIEAKLNVTSTKVERSMRSFIEKYNPEMGIIVFYQGEKEEIMINSTPVQFVDIAGLWNLLSETL